MVTVPVHKAFLLNITFVRTPWHRERKDVQKEGHTVTVLLSRLLLWIFPAVTSYVLNLWTFKCTQFILYRCIRGSCAVVP